MVLGCLKLKRVNVEAKKEAEQQAECSNSRMGPRAEKQKNINFD